MFDSLKGKLIDGWQDAWRFLSVQASVVLAVLATAYDYLPAIQQYFPKGWVAIAAAVIIFARVYRQTTLKK